LEAKQHKTMSMWRMLNGLIFVVNICMYLCVFYQEYQHGAKHETEAEFNEGFWGEVTANIDWYVI
jgi:hypothetical protein